MTSQSTATSNNDRRRLRRPDGRNLTNDDGSTSATLRPLSCELSCLHRSDGSSLWKSGSTHVMASVYGPVAPRLPMQEQGDQAVVSVLLKSTSTSASTSSSTTTMLVEREWEQLLTSVLSACIDTKAYARTVVEVVLQVIQDDGSVLAAALHAAVAALMDAGVAMTNLPVATTFLVVPEQSSLSSSDNNNNNDQETLILLDPSAEEERYATVLVLVTENEDPSRILATHSVGGTCAPTLVSEDDDDEDMAASTKKQQPPQAVALSLPTILTCAQAAAKATPAVVTFWRLAMEQRVTRDRKSVV